MDPCLTQRGCELGGRGQGFRRGRGEIRGRISNGRYDRVRAGSGAGSEWNNRWQILDQTGDDNDMSGSDGHREGAMGGDDGLRNGRGDSNVTNRSQERQQRTDGPMETDNSTEGENVNGRGGTEVGTGAVRKRNLSCPSPRH